MWLRRSIGTVWGFCSRGSAHGRSRSRRCCSRLGRRGYCSVCWCCNCSTWQSCCRSSHLRLSTWLGCSSRSLQQHSDTTRCRIRLKQGFIWQICDDLRHFMLLQNQRKDWRLLGQPMLVSMAQAFQPCLRLKESPWIRRHGLSSLQVLLQLIFRPLPSVGNRQEVPLETAKKLSWKHQLRWLRRFGRGHEPGSLKKIHFIAAAVRTW